MKKGRSKYSFQVNCDKNIVNSLMENFISDNGFQLTEKKQEQYYRAGNSLKGYNGLKYSFDNQTLTIEAWLDGALGNFPLDVKGINPQAMEYKNALNDLFQEISKINNGNSINKELNNEDANNQNINANNEHSITSQENINQFAQSFQEKTTKTQENLCEVGFWLSILGVVCSLFGIMYGVIIYIIDFYFASQGLNTRKKGKAIATIILSVISILIILFELLLS